MLRIGTPPTPPNGSSTPPPAGPAGPPPELLAALAAAGKGAGPTNPGAPPPSLPDDQGTPDLKSPSPRAPKFDAEKVGQDVARYLGPDSRCKSCSFFNADDSTCHVVSDQVDPEGVCSLWTGSDMSLGKKEGEKIDDGSDPSGESPISPDEPSNVPA